MNEPQMNEPMDEDFAYFYNNEGFGPALATRPVPAEVIEGYRGKLPDQLLKYWALYGWSGYGQGIFWTVDPEEYAPVTEAWLEGTRFTEDEEHYVIGRGAFGKLYLWGTRSAQNLTIETPIGMIFPRDQRDKIAAGKADFLVRCFFSSTKKPEVDFRDRQDKPLFERALQRLGPLAPDEMYGFVPAIALGGPWELNNLRKVKAVEHLILLAQLGERRVMADIVKVARQQGLMKK